MKPGTKKCQRSIGGYDVAEILMILGVVTFFIYLEYSDRKQRAIEQKIRHTGLELNSSL
jgi:hypothetical protein